MNHEGVKEIGFGAGLWLLGLEKTLVKNTLNMLALVSGSWISVWPDFRSDAPVLSFFLLLM